MESQKNTLDASLSLWAHLQMGPISHLLFSNQKEGRGIVHLIHIYNYSIWCNYTCCFIHQNEKIKIIQCEVNV